MDQQYSPVPPAQTTSTLAIVSLISGIVSWFLIPFIAAIAAVIPVTWQKARSERVMACSLATGWQLLDWFLGMSNLGWDCVFASWLL